jgi:hypothetical protein
MAEATVPTTAPASSRRGRTATSYQRLPCGSGSSTSTSWPRPLAIASALASSSCAATFPGKISAAVRPMRDLSRRKGGGLKLQT